MFLKRLIVKKSNDEIIRDIPFERGLNIISDVTTDQEKDSGNNVGKTTCFRAIDYCFGCDPKELFYTDKEFKSENKEVKDFLLKNNVIYQLYLTAQDGKSYLLERPFHGKPSINNQPYSSIPKYCEALNKLIFGNETNYPTIRQLIGKFIRTSSFELANTIKYLHSASPEIIYEAIYSVLFNYKSIHLLKEKQSAISKLKKLHEKYSGKGNELEKLKQELYIIDNDINKLNISKENCTFSEFIKSELDEMERIQVSISELELAIAKLNVHITLSETTLSKLQVSKTNVDNAAIRYIYEQAKINIATLAKKFDDVVNFHNQMIDNKIEFISKTLAKHLEKISDLRAELNKYISQKEILYKKLYAKGAFNEYDAISSKLNELFREKGNHEGLIKMLIEFHEEINKTISRITELNKSIIAYKNELNDNVLNKKFNPIFSEYSLKLYDEQYYLVFTEKETEHGCTYIMPIISTYKGNAGAGKKRARSVAFDLAYQKFSIEHQYKVPYFVIHDQLETVYLTQLETLFKLSEDTGGQLIVAFLSDKKPSDTLQNMLNKHTRLSLSQSNKFYGF